MSEAKPFPAVDENWIPLRSDRCGTCRFWDSAEDINVCRRYPPAFIALQVEPGEVRDGSISADAGFWPTTFHDDWCGEWQPAKTEGPKT